ncbi:hypothetical protein [Cellulomonas oligotrophica]|uniref:Uncharacterized protein n=1 Tax=Cellulomonas oligotrophica TaxID=931536 RepID=A0A7Y9FIF1_9CELL|nr:hypothetical protein [Cellulomonas oligotrophica]NYD87778.1 hypothetical protein [Cellulomonas oligotrophica]GIG33018.1 hypothetical protein Col01nite_21770 [Cellulomonas oligotrophica]
MGAISAFRADLKAALTEKVTTGGRPLEVHDVLPERFTPPALLLQPDDPWITTEGRPTGIGDVAFDVVLIAGRATSTVQVEELEALLEQAIDALAAPEHDWVLGATSAPFDLQLAAGTFLAVRVSTTRVRPITTT